MSKRLALLAGLCLVAGGLPQAQEAGGIRFDVKPVVKAGTTLVQMRPIFEYLSAKVVWNATTKQITATKGTTKILLRLGSKQATVNGQPRTLSVPPQTIRGHTMVPLRFVSEALGTKVDYHGDFITLCAADGSCTMVEIK
jgi:hypothetical protein